MLRIGGMMSISNYW